MWNLCICASSCITWYHFFFKKLIQGYNWQFPELLTFLVEKPISDLSLKHTQWHALPINLLIRFKIAIIPYYNGKNMDLNFHNCLRSGPRGLPPPPLTVSLTVKRLGFFDNFPFRHIQVMWEETNLHEECQKSHWQRQP